MYLAIRCCLLISLSLSLAHSHRMLHMLFLVVRGASIYIFPATIMVLCVERLRAAN